MKFWKKKREPKHQEIALLWLKAVVVSATRRIDNGDLDFDDWLYRARDAATTLIEIFTPPESESSDE